MPASKLAQESTQKPEFRPTVYGLISELCVLLNKLESDRAEVPSLAAGAHSKLWTAQGDSLAASRDRALELLRNLCQLLQGPHEYFHSLVSSNWDLGALYTIIELGILEKIPLTSCANVIDLSEELGLDERKLLTLLRLVTCSNILYEAEDGFFGHTALSQELLQDEQFRAFIGFQLFEARIGSVHLADSLKGSKNTFEHGCSAFKHAMGIPLYQWHGENTEKGTRFRMAMQGVSKSLDPGDDLFRQWFKQHSESGTCLTVVDVLGGNKPSQQKFIGEFPELNFVSVHDIGEIAFVDGPILAYVVRNVFWNKRDNEVISVIRSIHQAMEKNAKATLLINEMLSPARGEFPGDLEHAYRRRDVTTMTMHNAKQRTVAEWHGLFREVDLKWKIRLVTGNSSHSYRGLWEIQMN
ncbi:uncharacterized protein PV09_06927 [Verruconis gallopava]|uniref:O-methyltransferase domain-containing protein n=1 Tax=Verruconis gallopava TaxID=253628 RepID=A0A0D1XHN4_9PEZI|nr:uncharacterized protein PV09_06927 [Verruconis gallopava]KIW01751.1 hypothetical protein PV09_06927 [Verruconis gallopava]